MPVRDAAAPFDNANTGAATALLQSQRLIRSQFHLVDEGTGSVRLHRRYFQPAGCEEIAQLPLVGGTEYHGYWSVGFLTGVH